MLRARANYGVAEHSEEDATEGARDATAHAVSFREEERLAGGPCTVSAPVLIRFIYLWEQRPSDASLE